MAPTRYTPRLYYIDHASFWDHHGKQPWSTDGIFARFVELPLANLGRNTFLLFGPRYSDGS